MAMIPNTIKTAITGSVSVMLASLAIPQNRIDGAFAAFFSELDGKGTRSITESEPLDRSISRKQAAELLGRSTTCITRMVKNGKLHGIYGGADGKRLTGISEKSIRKFMNGGKEG